MCDLNETLFVTTADSMLATGLLDAGYDRLNLDDCWMKTTREPNGTLLWNTTLFPNGMPWLADYVKSKGFHFGIYQDSGNATCGGYPGSGGYEEIDAKTFESWGIDYLKLDGCNMEATENRTLQEVYRDVYGKWHEVFSDLENPLVFSESAPAYFSGGSDFPPQASSADWHRVMAWVPLFGELARHSKDINVYGLYEPHEYWESIMVNYGYEVLLARYQQPGFYNDPDFIIADWPWLSLDEKKSQFALWASFSAPLIISAYVPDLKPEEIEYLTNEDIIAVDQDPLALQATLVSQDGTWDVLTKSLANGDRLLTVLNRGNTTATTTISARRLGLLPKREYDAQDLWTGDEISVKGEISITLRSHATAIYRLSGVTRVTPTGMLFNTATKKCLTASGSSLTFRDCNAADSQVWQISKKGLIRPLSDRKLCITVEDDKVSLKRCNCRRNQQWKYHITGNVVNRASRKCFVQNDATAGVGSCGDRLDSQVFALPSGVKVLRYGIGHGDSDN